jgi:hypothetical protein
MVERTSLIECGGNNVLPLFINIAVKLPLLLGCEEYGLSQDGLTDQKRQKQNNVPHSHSD